VAPQAGLTSALTPQSPSDGEMNNEDFILTALLDVNTSNEVFIFTSLLDTTSGRPKTSIRPSPPPPSP
jgi:hypothetical protein